MAKLRLTQVRSGIGQTHKHRGTLRALGLGKIGRQAEHVAGEQLARAPQRRHDHPGEREQLEHREPDERGMECGRGGAGAPAGHGASIRMPRWATSVSPIDAATNTTDSALP